MAGKPKHATRESWLLACAEELRPMLADAGAEFENVRVSVGWPKGSRGGRGSHAIGQCWADEASADGHHEIFISPELADPIRVADVLTHELIHAALPTGSGHRKEFGKVARAVGLEGKLTATVAGDELRARLEAIVRKLGTFPHAELSSAQRRKQSTRMLKVECPNCGCIARMTARWLEAVGAPTCGCGEPMQEV